MWIRRIVAPTYSMPSPTAIIAPPEASEACIIGSTRPSIASPAESMRTPYTIIKKPSLRPRGVVRIPIIWTVLPRTTPPRRSNRIAPRYPHVTPIPVSVEAIGEVARIKRPTPRSMAPPAIPRTMEIVLGVRRAADVSGCMVSALQRFPEQREAHVVPIVDVGMGVLELLVHVSDPPVEELSVQRARPPDQVELVLRPAVDVHEPQATQPGAVAIHHLHRIPRAPALPDVGTPLAGLEVERKVDAHLLAPRIRRVVRRQPDRAQHRVHLLPAPVRLSPIPAEPFRRAPAPPERGEGLWEVHDVAEFEEGVPGMVGQCRPGLGMQHSLDDRAIPSGRLPPDAAAGDAELRFHEWDDFLPQVVVVSARPARVDILIPADPREAVNQGDDHRAHLPRTDEAVELRGQVLAERIDAEEHLASAGIANNPVRRRIAFRRIVFRREVYRDVPFRRVPQRVAFQHSRVERLDDDLPAGHTKPRRGQPGGGH